MSVKLKVLMLFYLIHFDNCLNLIQYCQTASDVHVFDIGVVIHPTAVYASYPTALKGCRGIVFTHGVRMGGRAAGNSLSRLYLRNRKV